MSNLKNDDQKVAANDTYYDFRNERKTILFLGAYRLAKTSLFYRVASVLYVILFLILIWKMCIVSFITIIVSREQKSVASKGMFTFCVTVCCLFYLAESYRQDENLEQGLGYIRSGFYAYNDGLDEEYKGIKRKRMRQTRFIISTLTKVYFTNVSINVVIFPLAKLVIYTVNQVDSTLTEYLPESLYFPMDTTSLGPFLLAFVSEGLGMLFFYTSIACYVEIVVSSILQLTTEYEVLNFSIQNIEKRALYTRKTLKAEHPSVSFKCNYEDLEFQRAMLFCLVENIRHHQVLLRYKKAMSYLEITAVALIVVISGLIAANIIIILEDPRKHIVMALTSLASIFTYYPLSYIGELLTTRSSNTMHYLYWTPWPNCEKNFRVNLKIFILNTIKPCYFRVAGLNIRFSVATFASILKNGYQLINILR